MSEYSIKDIEKLSGIKAGTIRIWEKRHGIVEPTRNQSNIRTYSDEDVKKLMNISILNNHGIKISALAKLDAKLIQQKVYDLAKSSDNHDVDINRLVVAMIDLEEITFEKIVSELALKYGFEVMITQVIYPFLKKIGVLWLTGNITPAQEHFISNLIRQKIIVAIDSIPYLTESNPKIALLFLPDGELHELGMLFHYYLIKKAGFKVIYLGQSVPYPDLLAIRDSYMIDTVLTSFVSPKNHKNIQLFLDKLSKDFKSSKVYISGYQIESNSFNFGPNIKQLNSAADLKKILKEQL